MDSHGISSRSPEAVHAFLIPQHGSSAGSAVGCGSGEEVLATLQVQQPRHSGMVEMVEMVEMVGERLDTNAHMFYLVPKHI